MHTADLPSPDSHVDVDAHFFRWEEETTNPRALQGRTVAHRVDAVHTVHAASLEAIRELLPSPRLRPARWSDGRGLVFVAATRYRDVTARDDSGNTLVLPPYAQVAVGVLLSGPHDVPRLAPYGHPLRGFVLHMAVTTAVAAESGRRAYGFPAFVADLAFHDSPHRRQVTVTEAGHGIVELHTHVHGHARPEHSPVVMYSACDGRLMETRGRFFGHRQVMLGGDDGALLLPGLHPVADRLRELHPDAAALVTVNHVAARMVFDGPVPVGEASGRAGFVPDHEQARGHYTVAYPDTPPLDQYRVPTVVGVLELPAAHRQTVLA